MYTNDKVEVQLWSEKEKKILALLKWARRPQCTTHEEEKQQEMSPCSSGDGVMEPYHKS